jgi:hypothetical protein
VISPADRPGTAVPGFHIPPLKGLGLFLRPKYRRTGSETSIVKWEPRRVFDFLVAESRKLTAESCCKKKCGPGQPPEPHLLCVNLHGCPSPRSPADFLETFCNASGKPALMQQRHIHTEVQLHPNRADRSQSRHARPFLRRPQRPGCPQRFHALGTSAACLSTLLSQIRRQLPQNQPCAITGSVTSTPAVRALSRIQKRFAIRNRRPAVRILWTMRIACGSSRKRWRKPATYEHGSHGSKILRQEKRHDPSRALKLYPY